MAEKEDLDLTGAGGVIKMSTGIIGLDSMLYGGLPKGSQVLVAGDAGTGKTLMTFEMLYRNGNLDIPGTYITLEETRADLLKSVFEAFSSFNNIQDLIERHVVNITEQEVLDAFKSKENYQAFVVGLNRTIKSNNSEIVVFDSLTPLRSLIDEDRIYTRYVGSLIENFRNLGVTSLTNVETSSENLTQVSGLYGTYMFDGIIKLSAQYMGGGFQYLITIVKMRMSNHTHASMPFEITSKGFNVFK